MCTGGFPNVGLPLLLLLMTASYRCHPQTLPHVLQSAATTRPPPWDSARVGAPGAPAPLTAMLRVGPSPRSRASPRRGPPKPVGTPASGSPSDPPRSEPEPSLWLRQQPPIPEKVRHSGCRGARHLRRAFSLFCGQNLPAFLRKAESKPGDLRLQLQVYYNGLLNQFVPL